MFKLRDRHLFSGECILGLPFLRRGYLCCECGLDRLHQLCRGHIFFHSFFGVHLLCTGNLSVSIRILHLCQLCCGYLLKHRGIHFVYLLRGCLLRSGKWRVFDLSLGHLRLCPRLCQLWRGYLFGSSGRCCLKHLCQLCFGTVLC